MKLFWSLLIAGMIGGVPAELQAQQPVRPAEAEDAEGRALGFLLRHRDQLRLSQNQIQRIEEIERRLEDQNRPLREQLVRAREQLVEQRRAELQRLQPAERRQRLREMRNQRRMGELPGNLEPIAARLRQNIGRAADQVRDVLTPEQRDRARELRRAEMLQLRRMRGQRPPGA